MRNFRARNIMRAMQPGQRCFFYHSNCKTPGVAGIMEVARAAYADHTQFDKASKYYDAKSTQDAPRWLMVDVKLVRTRLCCAIGVTAIAACDLSEFVLQELHRRKMRIMQRCMPSEVHTACLQRHSDESA